MSPWSGKLCKNIIRNQFGPIVGAVGDLLISRGRHSISHLKKALPDLTATQLHESLFILIQHNIAKYAEQQDMSNQKLVNYYSIDVQSTLLRLRIPLYINICRVVGGESAENVALAIAEHGKLAMSYFQRNALELQALRDLVSAGFLQKVLPTDSVCVLDKRIAFVKNGLAAKPGATAQEKRKIMDAAEAIDRFQDDYETGFKRPADFSSNEHDMKRRKFSIDDGDALYTFHDYAFCAFYRKHLYVKLASQKLDRLAGKTVEFCFQLAYHQTKTPYHSSSQPTSIFVNHLEALFRTFEPGKSIRLLSKSGVFPAGLTAGLSAILESMSVEAFGQRQHPNVFEEDISTPQTDRTEALLPLFCSVVAGKEYEFDFGRASEYVKRRMVESVVQQSFGVDALMVWRCLLMSGKLEEKGISRRCLLSSSEVRSLLFSMLKNDFVQTLDVPRLKDNTKNFYLWYVDLPLVVQRVTDRLHAACTKIIERMAAEQEKHAALAEKLQRDDVQGNLELLPDFEQNSWKQYILSKELLTANLCKLDMELLVLCNF